MFQERDRVVHNPARDDISTALAEAHRAVGFEDSVILMVAADDDTNLYDQQVVQDKHFGTRMCSVLVDCTHTSGGTRRCMHQKVALCNDGLLLPR